MPTQMKVQHERLCTQEELDEMCRTGVEFMHEAIESGNADAAVATLEKVQGARIAVVGMFAAWSAATIAYVLDAHGEEAVAALLDPEEWLALGLDDSPTAQQLELARALSGDPTYGGGLLRARVAAGDTAGAKRLWEQIEVATRCMHDHRRDWATSILAKVYRQHGVDGLEGALMHAGEQSWWLDFISQNIKKDPASRIAEWSFFLGVGNFGTVALSEDDERFSMHHAVCGSCARQQLAGRYEGQYGFPRVSEPRPAINFGNEDFTLYRTHLSAWHFISLSKIGLPPYPAVDCSGVPGRCWFNVYKDPSRTPARYYEKAGLPVPDAAGA